MAKKLFFASLFVVGSFLIVIPVFAQTCPHIYEGINCGTNWYCNGCQTSCPTCPGGGDPVGATELNYVSCTCGCPSGKIVCNLPPNTCITPPACSTPTRENAATCNGCGACKAGYAPDPAAPDAPNPCLKAAYVDYANTGTYFQISGDLKSASGDLYLASGKAIRIDGAGITTFNIGNFTGISLDLTFTGGLVVKGSMALTSQGAGTVNAEKLCIAGDCRTFWPTAVSAFVDEGNVGFGGAPNLTAVLGTNDNVPLAFEVNNTERMRIDITGNVTIGGNNICLADGTNCSGFGNYIWNTAVQQPSSNFNVSGDGTIGGDFYLSHNKAIRIDGAGTTKLNIGNWDGSGTGADVFVWGNLNIGDATVFPRDLMVSNRIAVGGLSPTDIPGTVNVKKLCFNTTNCRTSWPVAVENAFVDEGNEGFGPTAVLGTKVEATPVPLAFIINGVEKMRIDTAGNVGIGMASPGTTLDVNGVINAATGYRVGGVVAPLGWYLRGNGTNFVSSAIQAGDLPGSFSGFANPTASIGLSAVNGSATTAMRSDAAPALSQAIIPTWTGTHTFSNATYSALFMGGNVGIGTTAPAQLLSLEKLIGDNAELSIKSVAGVNTHWGIYQDRATGQLRFWQGDNRMIIQNTGQVGIGTTSPSYTLDVAGQINANTSATPAITGQTSSPGGYGIFGYARASSGVGVFGFADDSSAAKNFGGYFSALGTDGEGVSGTAPKYGGHFEASGVSGRALYAKATGTGGIGTYGETTSATGWAGYFTGSGYGLYADKLVGGTPTNPGTYKLYITGDGNITNNLVVDTDTFFVDATNNRVGIRKAAPNYTLDVSSTEERAAYITTSGTSGVVMAVSGWASASGDIANSGGVFQADGRRGIGVKGISTNSIGTNYGGSFYAEGNSGYGVYALAHASGAVTNYGGYFESMGNSGYGVYGTVTATSGTNYGVYGKTASPSSGWGGYFTGGQGLYGSKLMVDGTVQLGAAGTTMNALGYGIITVNPPSIAANSNLQLTVTISGATTTNRIFLTPPSAMTSGLVFAGAMVTAGDTITINIRNVTAAAIDGPSANWAYLLIQ